MLPGNMLFVSGNMLTVSRQHNYCSFMWRSTCISFYPATDRQQTGNNFVVDADNRACCHGVKRGLRLYRVPRVNSALSRRPILAAWLSGIAMFQSLPSIPVLWWFNRLGAGGAWSGLGMRDAEAEFLCVETWTATAPYTTQAVSINFCSTGPWAVSTPLTV